MKSSVSRRSIERLSRSWRSAFSQFPFLATPLAMTMAHNCMSGRPGEVVRDENGQPSSSTLTERETQVAQGKSNNEVAASLGFRLKPRRATAITSCTG
jgi:DNA-binding NarL/FixJ family response regulator